MKLRAIVAVAAISVVLVTACQPKFAPEDVLTVNAFGYHHRLSWPAATDLDGQAIVSYRIDVDGAPVATVAASARTCVLTGLAVGDHEVSITATDSAGEWSGDLVNNGRLTATISVIDDPTTAPTCTPTARVGGTGYSANPTVSGDGRYVAFDSDAADLVADDLWGSRDVFVLDRTTGVVTAVTPPDDSGGESQAADISADGRYVAFDSTRSNLAAGDANGLADVFVWDRTTGGIVRIGDAASPSTFPSISGDGRFVTFTREVPEANPGAGTRRDEVMLWDRTTGNTTQVTNTLDGSTVTDISDNGRYLAIDTKVDLLTGSGYTANINVYLWDRTTSTFSRITTPADSNSGSASISADGSAVAFTSGATNLAPPDTNNKLDVFVWDRSSGAYTRVTHGSGHSDQPSITADGTAVAFSSFASNLTPVDGNGRQDVFVWDRATTAITRITDGNGHSDVPASSGNGTVVVFGSRGSNVVPDDTNEQPDVFVWDRSVG